MRIDWELYALDIAEAVAKKSKDPWKKVGAVLLRHDHSVASVGYNGFPAGVPEDWSDREERRKYVIHAETNALRFTRPEECSVLACTLLPCPSCLKAVSGHGIRRVVYREVYQRDPESLEMAERMGIELKQYP